MARSTALPLEKPDAFMALRSLTTAVWRRFSERRLVGLASESAFWMLLALVPLAAVSGMLAARFAISNGVALGLLSRSLPHEAQVLLTSELNKVAYYNGGHIGFVTATIFVWLASSGVHAIFDAFEAATSANPRSWLRKRLLSIGCCIALAIGMAAIAVLVGHLEAFAQVADGKTPNAMSNGETFVRLLLGALVDLVLTILLFRFGISKPQDRSPLLPGAILAVVLQLALGAAYAAFIRELGDGSRYLAGLAVFAVTMTAVFIYMLSLLLGLTVNSVLAQLRREKARSRLFGHSDGAER